jgi:hypothetical protein
MGGIASPTSRTSVRARTFLSGAPPLGSVLRAVQHLVAERPAARRFALRAWIAAPVARAALATLGVRSTLRLAARAPLPTRARRESVGVAEGRRLVEAAFRHHVVGGECLPQSVVQYVLHRRDGLDVRLVLGVRKAEPASESILGGVRVRGSSIEAHAWVEGADGAASTDSFVELFASEAT